MSAKILLVRTGSDIFQAKAYVAVETGLYAREIQSLADLEVALKAEQFDLVIHDGSKLGKEPLALAETIRGHQRTAPILLLCAKPEMDVIVRAIRLGVRDLFHPPLNLGAFFARANELLQPRLNAHAETIALHCRHELTLFLAGESAAKGTKAIDGLPSTSNTELEALKLECERLKKELQAQIDRKTSPISKTTKATESAKGQKATDTGNNGSDSSDHDAEHRELDIKRKELEKRFSDLAKAEAEQLQHNQTIQDKLNVIAQQEKQLACKAIELAELEKNASGKSDIGKSSGNTLNTNYSNLKLDVAKLQKEHLELIENVKSLAATRDEMGEKIADQVKRAKELSKAELRVADREAALSQDRKSLDEFKARLVDRENAIETRSKALVATEAKHKALGEMEKALVALQAELEVASASTKQEQAKIKSQFVLLEEQRKVHEAEKESVTKALATVEALDKKNAAAAGELEKAALKLAETELALNQSLKLREEKLLAREALLTMLDQRETELASAEADLAARRTELDAEYNKLSKERDIIASEKALVESLKEDQEKFAKDLSIREEALVDRLAQVRGSEQKLSEHAAKLDIVAKTLDERDKRLDARVAAVGEMEKQLNAQKKSMDAERARIEAEAAGVEEAGHEIMSREKKLQQAQEQFAANKAQLDASIASHAVERKKLTKELAELDQQKVTFSVEREAFDAEIAQLKAREKAFEEKKKKLLEAM